jgi:hypothetical protein
MQISFYRWMYSGEYIASRFLVGGGNQQPNAVCEMKIQVKKCRKRAKSSFLHSRTIRRRSVDMQSVVFKLILSLFLK